MTLACDQNIDSRSQANSTKPAFSNRLVLTTPSIREKKRGNAKRNAKVENVAENPVGNQHENITNEKVMKLNEKARSEKRSHPGWIAVVKIPLPPVADKLLGNASSPNHPKSISLQLICQARPVTDSMLIPIHSRKRQ